MKDDQHTYRIFSAQDVKGWIVTVDLLADKEEIGLEELLAGVMGLHALQMEQPDWMGIPGR